MSEKLTRTTLFALEFGNIDKVSDGITEHYEYDGTPFAELSEQQKSEIHDSAQLKQFFKYTQELIDVFSGVMKTVVEAVAPPLNTVLDYMKKAEEEAAKLKEAQDVKEK